MGLYREQGIVLRTIRLGEADRIVSIMTQGRGKVRAVAKGVRKTKSRFGSRLEPLAHVSLLLYEGRELDVVTQAEALEHFRVVREDLDRLAKASSLLEAADQLAQERHANSRLYAMLLGGLRALTVADSAVLVPAFFLKLLSLEGFRPVVDACAVCEGDGELVGFDLDAGGVLCRACAGPRVRRLRPDGLDLVRRVLGGDLAGALAEPAGPAVDEVTGLATAALEHHLERRLRSIGVVPAAGRSGSVAAAGR